MAPAAADLAKLPDPAEQRLVGRLIFATSAVNLHVSTHAARTQLKAVYGKSDRRTQTVC
jgi:hypothetical protein